MKTMIYVLLLVLIFMCLLGTVLVTGPKDAGAASPTSTRVTMIRDAYLPVVMGVAGDASTPAPIPTSTRAPLGDGS